MYLIIPDWAVYTVLVAAWLGVFHIYVFQPFLLPKIDAYFAERRALRRLRRREAFDVNSTHPNIRYTPTSKKVNKRVPARHRR